NACWAVNSRKSLKHQLQELFMRISWTMLIAAALIGAFINAGAAADVQRVYIGTYTNGASEGIYTADFNPNSGAISNLRVAAKTENPSFLAKHPVLPVIYAAGEMVKEPDGDGGTVSAFRMEDS